jgi:hypothetical protein
VRLKVPRKQQRTAIIKLSKSRPGCWKQQSEKIKSCCPGERPISTKAPHHQAAALSNRNTLVLTLDSRATTTLDHRNRYKDKTFSNRPNQPATLYDDGQFPGSLMNLSCVFLSLAPREMVRQRLRGRALCRIKTNRAGLIAAGPNISLMIIMEAP